MKKNLLALTVTAAALLTSCSEAGNDPSGTSSPKVEKEVWGNTDNAEQAGSEPITLTYAIIGEMKPEEKKVIEQFNEADNGYVVETRDYSSYVADENGMIIYNEENREKFKTLDIVLTQDIANGEIDIFCDRYLNGGEKMDLYANKGAFADLYQFMENDPDVNTSTLNEHILKLHETNGKLYMLPTAYYIDTLVGQTRYVGSKENWNLDELISYWNQMPEGAKIDGNTRKDYVYFTILRQTIDSYIDYENAKVYFDSPEFIRALEFCNTFDDTTGYKSEYDHDAVNFVEHKSIVGFAEFHADVLWNEENQPVTLVGYPSESGSGAYISTLGSRYAISSMISEEKQKGAWEFIKTFATEDYQTENYAHYEQYMIDGEVKTAYYNSIGLPMNLKAYDTLSKEAMSGKHLESVVSKSGFEFEVGLLTQDELDRLTAYINSIQNLSISYDNDLWNIINDEILAYFGGERTAEETAKLIQDRASIMVSEKQ